MVSISKHYFISSESHWSFELIILVIFIVISYSLGHIIASFSAFFLDRLLVGKCFSYPYIVLFKLHPENSNNEFKIILYAIVFLLNILLIINLFFYNFYINISLIFIVLVLIYLLFVYIKTISAYNKKKFNRLVKILFDIIKIVGSLNQRFVSYLTSFLRYSINVYSSFDDDFISKFKKAYSKTFNSTLEKDKVLVYWFCRNFIIEKSYNFNSMLNNWFNLYSYSRNLSACFYLSYVYLLLFIYYQTYIVSDKFFINNFYNFNAYTITYKIFLIFLIVLSFILLVRFYYLYYTYYNKYLYRTFYFLYQQSNSKKNK